jgi:hypothetical protein
MKQKSAGKSHAHAKSPKISEQLQRNIVVVGVSALCLAVIGPVVSIVLRVQAPDFSIVTPPDSQRSLVLLTLLPVVMTLVWSVAGYWAVQRYRYVNAVIFAALGTTLFQGAGQMAAGVLGFVYAGQYFAVSVAATLLCAAASAVVVRCTQANVSFERAIIWIAGAGIALSAVDGARLLWTQRMDMAGVHDGATLLIVGGAAVVTVWYGMRRARVVSALSASIAVVSVAGFLSGAVLFTLFSTATIANIISFDALIGAAMWCSVAIFLLALTCSVVPVVTHLRRR